MSAIPQNDFFEVKVKVDLQSTLFWKLLLFWIQYQYQYHLCVTIYIKKSDLIFKSLKTRLVYMLKKCLRGLLCRPAVQLIYFPLLVNVPEYV